MSLLKAVMTRKGLLALSGLAVLSACVVVEDPGPRPRPIPPDDGPRYCTREYDPVCAVDSGERRTFGNACEARLAGYRIVSGGECRRREPRPDPRPGFCTREYAPVCARRGGEIRTFGNACEADAARFRVVSPGPC